MDRDLVRLSKAISRALRHEPWVYELEPDDEGWVPVAALLEALREERPGWRGVSEREIARIIAESDKRRFELAGGRIRALYGHSLPGRLRKEPAPPPAILYHGTTREAAGRILREGLRPMGRQYVHLSTDETTAHQVAARRRGPAVLLTVAAGEAHRHGVAFYLGNEQVWLADAVPPEWISAPGDLA
jgi:putative RNA 2'-phosphotransferase